jgi:F-type H+-transporting ATPase subunit delta
MKNLRAARRYAVALLSVAEERRVLESVAKDMESVARTLRASRELQVLVRSPIVTSPRKLAIFRELFSARIGAEAMQFVELLIRKQREALLPEVVEEFLALRDERTQIVNVDVTAAVEIASAQEKELKGVLERQTGKHVRMRVTQDPDIMGGLVVRIGDTVLDGSVRHQLEQLHRRFVEGASQ